MIDWKKVWREFGKWYGEVMAKKRKEVGNATHEGKFDPDWNQQQQKIQQLVEKQIKKEKR